MEWGKLNQKGLNAFVPTCKMISKECLYNIVRVKDLESEAPHLVSVPY